MSHYDQQQAPEAYPPPVTAYPPSYGHPQAVVDQGNVQVPNCYVAPPPPIGYPTRGTDAAAGYPQHMPPVETKTRGEGFWKGWYVCLFVCFASFISLCFSFVCMIFVLCFDNCHLLLLCLLYFSFAVLLPCAVAGSWIFAVADSLLILLCSHQFIFSKSKPKLSSIQWPVTRPV